MAMVGDSRRPGQTLRYYADLIVDAETEEIRVRCGGDGRAVVRFRRRGYAVSRNQVNLGASALAAASELGRRLGDPVVGLRGLTGGT